MPSSRANKGLCFENGTVALYFDWQEWDSQFFGKPCYRLNLADSHPGLLPERAGEITRAFKGAFVTAVLPHHWDHRLQYWFQEIGFRFIATEVVLSYVKDKPPGREAPAPDILIERRKDNKGLCYEAFARVFANSRFHADPRISNRLADELWVAYLRNYRPGPNKIMYAARKKADASGDVKGAILVNVDPINQAATLFFVAVVPSMQGLNIGSTLIQEAVRDLKVPEIRVETQARNINALNFYIKNGFQKVAGTAMICHRWT